MAVTLGQATSISASPDSGLYFYSWTVQEGSASFASTGGATSQAKSDSVTLSSGDATILASFGAVITYSANGASSGAAPSATLVPLGAAAPLSSNSGSLAKAGYLFQGWNTAADGGGTLYAEGASFTPSASLTLYADWTKRVSGSTSIEPIPAYVVAISGPTTLHVGAQSTFTETYAGTASGYAWYMDGSSTVLGRESTLAMTPTFAQYGKHRLTLVIADANGLSYADSLAISVEN